ncbi:MAG: WYL domain-containing protein, partial [Chloroflexi bacterium]|nr:WYL domain-containing protein [Chloroflexota bacterium]
RVDAADPPDEDGWITLDMCFESLEVAASCVLGMGYGVEVLDPPDVRQRVVAELRKMATHYGDELAPA